MLTLTWPLLPLFRFRLPLFIMKDRIQGCRLITLFRRLTLFPLETTNLLPLTMIALTLFGGRVPFLVIITFTRGRRDGRGNGARFWWRPVAGRRFRVVPQGRPTLTRSTCWRRRRSRPLLRNRGLTRLRLAVTQTGAGLVSGAPPAVRRCGGSKFRGRRRRSGRRGGRVILRVVIPRRSDG